MNVYATVVVVSGYYRESQEAAVAAGSMGISAVR
jgi:hypothetical protein